MSWRDELRPASFRGVPFETRGMHELTGGRRRVVHEYPQRDEPSLEDMGRKARSRKITAFVIGPDYMAGRDALITALEEEGSGELILPFGGRLKVGIGDFTMRESTEFGGMAEFSIDVTEDSGALEPESDVDADGALEDSQEEAFDDVADDFASGFDLSGLPAWSLNDIEASINEFLDLDAFKDLVSQVLDVKSRIGDLLQVPLDLATTLIGLIKQADDVQSIFDVPYIPVRSWRGLGSAATTATRGVVVQRQSDVNMLFHRAALVQETALIGSLPTRKKVEEARERLLDHFDAHDATPGLPRPAPTLARALQDLRVNALIVLRRQAAALPRSYTLQLLQPTPAVVLAYELYEDLRASEIVERNDVRHPGFVPAGVPLEVTGQ